MKKIGIVTINGDRNYGNKLQNYALSKFLKDYNFEVYTLWEERAYLHRVLSTIKRFIIKLVPMIDSNKSSLYKREDIFKKFDAKYIKRFYIKRENIVRLNRDFDYFVIGSDQIWNPNVIDIYFGSKIFETNVKKIAYAPSIGVSVLPSDYFRKVKELFKEENIKYISFREETGTKLISEATLRSDIQTLIDPTLLLNSEDWEKMIRKPDSLKKNKYILNYFLGELSEERKKEIERIAKENDCEVINILDKSSPYYFTGPSEFLYLEKNAFLICTDSFHSSVFGLIFNRPFIIFDREDSSEDMGSRLSDFLEKFSLKNRKFKGVITNENLNHDYTEAYKILRFERIKSREFIEKALNIK